MKNATGKPRVISPRTPDHTLQTTALVHESLPKKLIDHANPTWQNPPHFFGIAAQACAGFWLITQSAGSVRNAAGGARIVPLEMAALAVAGGRSIDLVALDEAFDASCRIRRAKGADCRTQIFSGLSIERNAELCAFRLRR